jgi:hypothetical protein
MPPRADAQLSRARFGMGLNTLLSSDDGLGIGFRGRVSSPVNSDLSFAADLGITGFVLEGRDEAVYVIDPQVSAIVTLQGVQQAPYVLAGVGGYFVASDHGSAKEGPSIHVGVGWVRALRETLLFYEIDPALVIGDNSVAVAIPFRIGVIF